MPTIIDARGRSCPEPVLMTKKAIASAEKSYEVLVDNNTAAGNVTRFANNAGYSVETSKDGDVFHLKLKAR